MKKINLRRMCVFALSAIMALSMGASVFAAGPENLGEDQSLKPSDNNAVISNGGVKQDGVNNTTAPDADKYGIYSPVDNTVRIDKEIIVFNTRTADTKVFLPNITYSYTIEPASVTGEKYVTDEYGLKSVVRNGVGGAISTQSADVSFNDTNGIMTGSTTINATPYIMTNQNGASAEGYFDVTFNPSAFAKPGIYRYVITESDSGGRAAAGVTNDKDKYGDKRYLDVYVQNNAAGTGYEIYGYVLYEDGTNANKEFDATGTKPIPEKTNGFVSDKNDDDSQAYDPFEKDVDIYQTANVKVEKQVTGALGDKTNEFPFEATILNSSVTSQAKFSYQIVSTGDTLSTAENATNPTKTLSASGSVKIGNAGATAADSFTLKDDEYIYIYGVPGKGDGTRYNDLYSTATTVEVKEYNNTSDMYNVAAEYNTETLAPATNITTQGTDTHREMPKATVAAIAPQTVVFTNTEDYMTVTNSMYSISPTNVAVRYAPYLMMLLAAAFVLVATRRRDSEEA